MRARLATVLVQVAGQGRPAAAVALLLAAAAAHAGDPPAAAVADEISLSAAEALSGLGQWDMTLAEAVLPGDQAAHALEADAPAHELAEGLGVQVEQSRRKFRAQAMDWITGRSQAVGRMADFLIGGGDSGWHLTVDPRGDDEYQLQWKARFR